MDLKKVIFSIASISTIGFGIYKLIVNKEPPILSDKWLNVASDDVLHELRENVRLAYSSAGRDAALCLQLERLRDRIDRELSKRDWAGYVDTGVRIAREHGRYLPNDE